MSDQRFFLTRDVSLEHRPRVQRGSALRESCDQVRIPGTPLKGLAPSSDELVLRRLVSIFLVPAVILIVWWTIGSGFQVSVPVERESDDRVRSYE
jgi:hypothetical protein